MVQETEEVNAEHETGTAFLDLLPDTSQKYLGLYNDGKPQDSKTAALRNMLMVRRNYDALVSGDGACAGCGEKSVLRSVAAVTEAYMRPIFHAKADRFRATADVLDRDGVAKLEALKAGHPEEYELFKQTVAHLLMGLGGENEKDTKRRIADHGPISDKEIVGAITAFAAAAEGALPCAHSGPSTENARANAQALRQRIVMRRAMLIATAAYVAMLISKTRNR